MNNEKEPLIGIDLPLILELHNTSLDDLTIDLFEPANSQISNVIAKVSPSIEYYQELVKKKILIRHIRVSSSSEKQLCQCFLFPSKMELKTPDDKYNDAVDIPSLDFVLEKHENLKYTLRPSTLVILSFFYEILE